MDKNNAEQLHVTVITSNSVENIKTDPENAL